MTAQRTIGPVPAVIVMGVSGVGKSVIGRALADMLDVPFLEGDEFHPPGNRAKMQKGIALDDVDRAPWLDALGSAIADRRDRGLVAACSALKRSYRERLRSLVAPPLVFVCLVAGRAVLKSRLAHRGQHFMPASLLASQLATLELPGPDEPAITIQTEGTVDEVLDRIMTHLHW